MPTTASDRGPAYGSCVSLAAALVLVGCGEAPREPGADGARVSASPSAAEVIEHSRSYHDPEDRWFSSTNRARFRQLRPGVGDRLVDLTLYPASDRFDISMREEGDSMAGSIHGTACDFPDSMTASAARRFGELDCEGVLWWRGYYSYQLSAPMHLTDPAARIDSAVRTTTFAGSPVYALRVTYEAGQPVWDYYFDREDFRLRGARFSSDGLGGDGEYIVFEGEVTSAHVRLPARRVWYMNADSSRAGEDILIELQSTPAER